MSTPDGLGIAVRDLEFAYPGASPCLRGVNLDLEPGSFTAIVGQNGSGKTTLLRLLAGIRSPLGGRVDLGGRDIARWDPRERARALAMVPQSLSVAFAYTVDEMVSMGRTPHLGRWPFEGPADRQVVRAAMETAEIAHLASRPFESCSGGERRRVLIARALAQQPTLLLLDEPAAHLDLHHAVALYTLLARLNREEGLTVVVVTHDLNLPAQCCPRLVLLGEGRVVDQGEFHQVLDRSSIGEVLNVDVLRLESGPGGRRFVVPVLPPDDGSTPGSGAQS